MNSSVSETPIPASTTPIRVGVIGLGFMGRTHVELYRRSDKAVVAAVADANPARLEPGAEGTGGNVSLPANTADPLSPVPDPRGYTDGLALIANEDLDLVDICLPVHLHRDLVRAALETGRHVMCEKPLTRSAAEAVELFTLAEQKGRLLMNGLCLRFWPAYQWNHQHWTRGDWGRPRQAFFKRLSPHPGVLGAGEWLTQDAKSGGALLEMHLHDIDQIRWFLGRPLSVHCFGCRAFRSSDCWDHVFTRYDFGDGSLIMAEGGWTAAGSMPFDMQFQMISEQVTVRFDGDAVTVFRDGGSTNADLSVYPHRNGWEGEIHALLDALQSGAARPPVPPQEVVDGLCIAEAERRSADTGCPVDVHYLELPRPSTPTSAGVPA